MSHKTEDLQAIKAATTNKNVRKPPLDFTFMCLTSISDCLEEDPRGLVKVKKSGGKGKVSPEIHERTKHDTTAIRFSNNVISEWSDFSSCVTEIIKDPSKLEWIDLSFNDIIAIDQCILDYPNLKVLYLHGNSIEKMSEIDKLCELQHLRSLTLHGNPIEEDVSGYRQHVISTLPQLKHFDFSAVTKQDKASAQTWNHMVSREQKRSQKK